MVTHEYLPFLPHDNWLLEETTGEILEILNEDFRTLLMDVARFWQVVRYNSSLHQCLSSYLQYARRLHDEAITESSASSDLLQALHRRVFMIFMRMVTVEPGGLAREEQAALLYNDWLLDMPKLLDIAVLYGRDNTALVQQLMQKAFGLQPLYGRDAAQMAPTLLSNFADVAAALQQAASELASGNLAMLQSLTDGVMYWEDVTETLAAFIEAFPPGGALLMQSKGAIAVQLASVHNSLLPQVHASISRAAPAETLKVRKRLDGLRSKLQHLVHLLTRTACIDSSRQIPPPAAAAWKSILPQTPAARGELLVGTLTEISERDGAGASSVLACLEHRYGLGRSISAAVAERYILLDSVQHDYLLALLGTSAGSRTLSNGHPQLQPSTTGRTGGVSADAEQASRISSIKELLPGYGDGFLAECLSAFGQSPESVINALLEGSLPPQLSGLDSSMPLRVPLQNSKGKGASHMEGEEPSAALAQLSWHSLSLQDEAKPPQPKAATAPSYQQLSSSKPVHKGVSRFLDRAGAADRAAIKAHAQQAQYDEYDDEYDDSYDDLGVPSADGVADVDGDDAEKVLSRSAAPVAMEPNSRGGPQRPSGISAPRPKVDKVWVHEGRFYNYAKPGAVEYSSTQGAQAALSAARAAADAIHGLGRGGNVPVAAEQASGRGGPSQGAALQAPSSGAAPSQQGSVDRAPDGPQQNGRGRGGGPGRGPSAGRGSHAHKDKHKAAIANHHRKDRALRKMGGPAPGGP